MKLFTLWRITLLSALFSLLGMGSAWAQLTKLEVGGVYHFVNAKYTDKAMVATTPSSIAGVTADNTNRAQLWYVADEQVKEGVTYYALRNLGYGTYLQGNGQSSAWTLANTTGSDKSWFALTLANGKTAIRSYNERNNNHGFAHIDGSSNVVGWSTDAQATQWNISKIEMSSADIQTALGIFGNVASYQTALDALFTDKACTELKVTFDENNASFNALHPTLQNMVRKVAGTTSWEENYNNGKEPWSADYAKKYRVQLYEPYNDAGAAASALGLNAHNSLNNPTGIFANNGDVLYVMVDGEIKKGASLYLAYYTGHGKLDASSKVGYELKQGLNVIPVYQNSSNFCVNYIVQTFDTSDGKKGNKAKACKLSEYAPIKIHIEGGYINGYYNKMGDELYGSGDKSADWDYIEARATQKDVTVLGQYTTLQFPLNDADTEGNKGLGSYFNELVNIEPVIDEWDNVMLWERLVLGVLDKKTIEDNAKKSPYSDKDHVFAYTGDDTDGFGTDYGDYYNVHGLAFGVGGDAYMYGGWDHCGYHYNTMGGVILNLPTDAGSHWGPGHEIGHQHQALLTVNGLTEVTNNLFSNVVLWYFGETTSRYNGTEGALSNVLAQFNAEGTDFFSNNIWAQTIMYYKLFLYYHVLGHNPKFYPRLFEMLRQDPMSTGYAQDGSKCLMHFYKKCCLAAGEDLTEFFRAHGFFEVMDNRLVGDYSNSVYNLTQAQIDAAIKEVKDLGYKENISVLFINDATGETIKSYKGDNLEKYGETTICSEIGSYASFATATTPSYNYSILGNTVTMEGSGGVGFAIFNEKGEIIGFSDKKTFEVSNETALLIASGKAEIKTINADQSEVKAVDILKTVSKEEVRAALLEILNKVKADVIDLTDKTNSQKPGFYKARDIVALTATYDKAKTAYEEENSNAYQTVIEELNVEYLKALNSTNNRVPIVAGTTYVLTSKKYPNKSMNNTDSGLTGAETNSNSSSQQWVLESAGSENTFYIKSKSTNYYLGNLAQSTKISATADKAGATPYLAFDLGAGLWALQCQTESDKQSLHCDGSSDIVGWWHTGTGDDGSWWYLTGVESEEVLSKFLLEDLIEQTEALINEVGVITTHTQKVDLTENSYHSNAECKDKRYGDQFTSYNVLCDNNPSTFFHSDYSEEAPNEDHYIRMDVGEGNELKEFNLYYTTRKEGNLCAPTKMAIEGSNDDKTWDIIRDITSGLPTSNNTAHTITGLKGDNAYRYIRMRVYMNSSNQHSNGHYYFIVSELGLQEVTYQVAPNTLYASIDAKALQEAFNQQNAAIEKLSTATSQDDINNAYTALLSKYNALKDAKQTVENATLNAKKEVLKTLINNTTTLIGQCGTVTYTPATFNGEAALQTTNTTGDFYVSTNADQNTGGGGNDGGGIAALVDNNEGTYFHTRWGGTTVNEPHYFQVDLGEELSTNNFTFSYKPRNGSPAPTAMKVYGSNDGTIFTDVLATITEGLPAHDSGNTYQSSTISSEISYRYLRFTVTKSAGPGNTQYGGQYFFGMLEFDLNLIGSPESYTVQLNQGIGNDTEDLLIATYKENQEAQSTYDYATTKAQVEKAIANLQAQYKALEDALNDMKDKKAELQALIDQTNALVEACATVKTIEAKTLTLNTSAAPYKLSDSHGESEENLDNLLDGNTDTYYVSNWNVAATVASYLQVDLGTGNELEELIFTFTNRPSGNAPTPTEIVVSASADGNTFTDLATFTQSEHNLPPAANNQNITATPWTSPTIQATSACRYWRFTVTKSHRNNPLPNNAHFGISEFGVQQTADEQAALKFVSAEVTGEMVVNAYRQAIESGNILANPTSIAQLEQAIAELQEQYNTLNVAKQNALQSAKQAAQNFLNATANKVGYPTQEAQTALQTVITESSDINAINTALQTYKESADIIMPTSDKVYTLKVRYIGAGREGHKYMNVTADKTFSLETVGNEALPETAYFICRKDANTGRYYFVPAQGGGYLSYQGVTATHLAGTCAWEVKPLTQCNKTYISDATAANLLGYFGIRIDQRGANGTQDWYFIVDESSNGFSNSSAPFLDGSYTSAILIEEVSGYTLNKVNLTTTSTAKDKLLKGIADQQTISTFSAPYATVIPKDVTAYYASQEYNGNMLYLKAIEEGLALPANEGVILVGNVDVKASDFVPAATETVAVIDNKFSNSAAASVVMENNDYILANGDEGIGIYKAKAGTRLKQGKAFLRMGSTSNAPSFIMNFGGNATGVEITLTDGATGEQVVYDLYGRRVTEVTKGRLYIVNGKKVFIK